MRSSIGFLSNESVDLSLMKAYIYCPFLRKNGCLGLEFGGISRGIATSCRAVLLPRFGGPDVLELRDNVPVPDLKPNEVLVRARAVSINPLDLRVCLFNLSVFRMLRINKWNSVCVIRLLCLRCVLSLSNPPFSSVVWRWI